MGREVDARRRTTRLRLAGGADSAGRELGRGRKVARNDGGWKEGNGGEERWKEKGRRCEGGQCGVER